ncbi:hypothetical protein BC938DRAFT_474020, partial [Jimgerdemannia flammicorona]
MTHKRNSTPEPRYDGTATPSPPATPTSMRLKMFRKSWSPTGSSSSTTTAGLSLPIGAATSEIEYKDLERALARFQTKERHRLEILRTQVITWLERNEGVTAVAVTTARDAEKEKVAAAGKIVLIKWTVDRFCYMNGFWRASYAERCFYFECILAIMIRCVYRNPQDHPSSPDSDLDDAQQTQTHPQSSTLGHRPVRQRRQSASSGGSDDAVGEYRAALAATMAYAVERLNQRGVYANVVGFCAKVFALCFFKIPGVAAALLHALPIGRGLHKRMHRELGSVLGDPENEKCLNAAFPPHIRGMICLEPVAWVRRFERQWKDFEPPIEMAGNWIRRL